MGPCAPPLAWSPTARGRERQPCKTLFGTQTPSVGRRFRRARGALSPRGGPLTAAVGERSPFSPCVTVVSKQEIVSVGAVSVTFCRCCLRHLRRGVFDDARPGVPRVGVLPETFLADFGGVRTAPPGAGSGRCSVHRRGVESATSPPRGSWWRSARADLGSRAAVRRRAVAGSARARRTPHSWTTTTTCRLKRKCKRLKSKHERAELIAKQDPGTVQHECF